MSWNSGFNSSMHSNWKVSKPRQNWGANVATFFPPKSLISVGESTHFYYFKSQFRFNHHLCHCSCFCLPLLFAAACSIPNQTSLTASPCQVTAEAHPPLCSCSKTPESHDVSCYMRHISLQSSTARGQLGTAPLKPLNWPASIRERRWRLRGTKNWEWMCEQTKWWYILSSTKLET